VAEVPRSVSFCGHAILQDEPFIITNALEDARFCDNPLVVGAPFIRFYGGIPLHGPQGHLIGSYCIIDTKPRQMNSTNIDQLKGLARWVELELNFGALSEDFEKTEVFKSYLSQHLVKNNQELEFSNKKQTKELQERVVELELLNRISIGRELKMIEMKKEVNLLSKRLNLKEPYNLEFLNKEN
jgi:hypothetical protein